MNEQSDRSGGHAGAFLGSEESYRLMVDSVVDYAIIMIDPEGLVASWNEGAERLKGYQASEIIGQHFSRFYPPGSHRRRSAESGIAHGRRARPLRG